MHIEDKSVKGFKNLKTLRNRFDKYVGKKQEYIGENCYTSMLGERAMQEQIAEAIFNGWLNSKTGHKQILLSEKAEYGACSVSVKRGRFPIKILVGKSKGKTVFVNKTKFWATLNVYR